MLIIARHGRTTANALGLLQGRIDNPIDDAGRAQAEAIARAIGSADVIVSSPLLRCVETAAPLLDVGPAESVEVDNRWIELDYGAWEAKPIGDVSPATWAQWRADADFAPPGGESLNELNARVGAACDDLVELATVAVVVVFTHVSPIKAAMRWALGVDEEISWRLHVAQAQISRIAIRGGRPAITSFNDTSHLDP